MLLVCFMPVNANHGVLLFSCVEEPTDVQMVAGITTGALELLTLAAAEPPGTSGEQT